MATTIEFLDNLPIKFPFSEPPSCLCDTSPFKQLAQFTDPAFIIFKPKTVDVTVNNPNFTGNLTGWTAGSGWAYNSNNARLTNNTGSLEQNISHTVGQIYKITFTVSNYSGGSTNGLYVSLGATSYATEVSTGIIANGTYTIFLTPSTSANLKFFATTSDVTLDLDTILVEKIEQCYELTVQEGDSEYPAIAKKMYVVNYSAGTVSVLSIETLAVTATITMPSAGLIYASCFDYYNQKVWIGWQNGIFIIDAVNDVVETTLNLSYTIDALSYDNDNGRIMYGLNSQDDELVAFNADDQDVNTTVSTGNQPVAIFVHPTTKYVYVCNYLDDEVEVRDAGAGSSVIDTIAITRPRDICYDSTANQLFISSVTTNTVVVVNAADNTISDTIVSITDPRELDYDLSTQQVYVASYSTDSVIVIDATTNAIADTITGIAEPTAVTADKINNRMYVSKHDTSSVAIIECSDNSINSSVGVGANPLFIGSTFFERTPVSPTYYKDVAYAMPTWQDLIGTSSEGCYQIRINDTCAESSTLSMGFNVKETHPCTIGVSFFGSVNGFGVPYEQFAWVTYPYPISLTLRNKYNFMRLQGYLLNAKYPAEVARYIDSGGSQRLYYGSNRKEKTMFIVECPEYVHDAIATGFLHDNLYFDSVRMQWLDSSYDPEWSGDNNYLYLAKSRAQLGYFTDDNKSID